MPHTLSNMPSVLWHCWLGGRKGIRPVKTWVVGCWCGYLSGSRCRLAYGPADATVSCFSKIQIGFTFLVPAHLGSPGKRAVKRVCVCVFIQWMEPDVLGLSVSLYLHVCILWLACRRLLVLKFSVLVNFGGNLYTVTDFLLFMLAGRTVALRLWYSNF